MKPMFDRLFSKRERILRAVKILAPRVLVCLTYPSRYPELPQALVQLRRIIHQIKKDGNCGVWFLAYQARGAPFFWILLSRYVEREVLASSWYHIVESHDPLHLKAGTSISGFHFLRGREHFLTRKILPLANSSEFPYGVFGSLRARIGF